MRGGACHGVVLEGSNEEWFSSYQCCEMHGCSHKGCYLCGLVRFFVHLSCFLALNSLFIERVNRLFGNQDITYRQIVFSVTVFNRAYESR